MKKLPAVAAGSFLRLLVNFLQRLIPSFDISLRLCYHSP